MPDFSPVEGLAVPHSGGQFVARRTSPVAPNPSFHSHPADAL